MIDRVAQTYLDEIQYEEWLLEEGFKITYNNNFEWDSDKANKVRFDHENTDFRIVSTIFYGDLLRLKTDYNNNEERIRVIGKARDGNTYSCTCTK